MEKTAQTKKRESMKKIEGITVKKLWDMVKKSNIAVENSNNQRLGYYRNDFWFFAYFVKAAKMAAKGVKTYQTLYTFFGTIRAEKIDGLHCITVEDFDGGKKCYILI